MRVSTYCRMVSTVSVLCLLTCLSFTECSKKVRKCLSCRAVVEDKQFAVRALPSRIASQSFPRLSPPLLTLTPHFSPSHSTSHFHSTLTLYLTILLTLTLHTNSHFSLLTAPPPSFAYLTAFTKDAMCHSLLLPLHLSHHQALAVWVRIRLRT